MTNKEKAGIALVLLLVLGVATTASAGEPEPKTDDGPEPPVGPPKPEPEPDDTGLVLADLPPLKPPGPVADVPQAPLDPTEVDYDEWIKHYPTGGTFYPVKQGDMFGGKDGTRSISYRLLLTEGFLAAKNVGGLDDEEAGAFARKVANSGSRRIQARTLIQCSMINDMVYGTWGYGDDSAPGPHGRAIRLVPQHAHNERRLRDGEPLIRNIRMRFPENAGDGSGLAADPELRETWELLYMPKLNEEKLWNSGGVSITTEGMAWDNGTDMGNWPPPWAWRGGVENMDPDAEAFMMTDEEWGCDA